MSRRAGIDVFGHDTLRAALAVVVMQRPELEQRNRLREIQVPPDDPIIDNLVWFEDVGGAEVGSVVLLEQRPTVREDDRVVVDVHHAGFRLDTLGDLVSVLRGGQPRPAVEELGDAHLTGEKASHPDQKVPVVPRELADLRCDPLKSPDELSIDLVVVLAAKGCVITPGKARLGRVEADSVRSSDSGTSVPDIKRASQTLQHRSGLRQG